MTDATGRPRYRVFLSHAGDGERPTLYLAIRIDDAGADACRGDARFGDPA
jgi:hypothetical protein